jgi:hypothetical protein
MRSKPNTIGRAHELELRNRLRNIDINLNIMCNGCTNELPDFAPLKAIKGINACKYE